MTPRGTRVDALGWEGSDRFQHVLFDAPEHALSGLGPFDGRSFALDWDPPDVYVPEPLHEIPDIWRSLDGSLLVMEPATVNLLEPYLMWAGELLPLTVAGSGEQLLALNVLRVVDCLDPKRLKMTDSVIHPHFLEHRLPETGLFKIPGLASTTIFSVERSDDDDSFRRRVRDLGLRGSSFRPVWTSESGGSDDIDLLLTDVYAQLHPDGYDWRLD